MRTRPLAVLLALLAGLLSVALLPSAAGAATSNKGVVLSLKRSAHQLRVVTGTKASTLTYTGKLSKKIKPRSKVSFAVTGKKASHVKARGTAKSLKLRGTVVKSSKKRTVVRLSDGHTYALGGKPKVKKVKDSKSKKNVNVSVNGLKTGDRVQVDITYSGNNVTIVITILASDNAAVDIANDDTVTGYIDEVSAFDGTFSLAPDGADATDPNAGDDPTVDDSTDFTDSSTQSNEIDPNAGDDPTQGDDPSVDDPSDDNGDDPSTDDPIDMTGDLEFTATAKVLAKFEVDDYVTVYYHTDGDGNLVADEIDATDDPNATDDGTDVTDDPGADEFVAGDGSDG